MTILKSLNAFTAYEIGYSEMDKMITTRKLNQVRNSFYVYLPRQWCDAFNLTKDSEVKIEQSTDGVLRISPPNLDREVVV